MGIVDYSDSESDTEAARAPEAPKAQAKPAFHKAAPGKIKVDLPDFKLEPGQAENTGADGPPAKRARTGGAFSGFNSLLPAPRKTGQNAPKAGVSLKTSSEAAFSRNPVPQVPNVTEDTDTHCGDAPTPSSPAEELKLIGKATRFLPLSVANNKKKKKPITKAPTPTPPASVRKESTSESGQHSTIAKTATANAASQAQNRPKPRRSLFSLQTEEEAPVIRPTTTTTTSPNTYEPLLASEGKAYLPDEIESPQLAQQQQQNQPHTAAPNSLESVANDLNLTPSQRRQLFGRSVGRPANITQFNLDSEYRHNEELRAAGEVVEHRTVKAIAPGKHSLQQLVNNARTQQDAMEDKWAEGRRNQGGGSYGWKG